MDTRTDTLSAVELLRLLAANNRAARERLEGLACVACGRSETLMVSIATPDNPCSSHVFACEEGCR